MKKVKFQFGYIEDVCQWTFYRKDLTNDQKIETILKLENMIQNLLNDVKINYIPIWSTKLK